METSGHGIDKRLSRMDRWLKRCMAACRCGSWSSALMEIECMEAETRECREELWSIAGDEARGRSHCSRRASALFGARTIILATVIVLTSGFPLSVDQDLPFKGFTSYGGDSVAVLTSTESDILEALRASLSSHNEGRVALILDRPREETTAPPVGAAAAEEAPVRAVALPQAARPPVSRIAREARSEDVKTAPVVAVPVRRVPAEEPSVEEVISLIQVGQRALRISEPAVRVVEP